MSNGLGFALAYANAMLDNEFPNTVWLQLHVDHPGPDGTANIATESTRRDVAVAAAASGERVTAADVTWTNVAATEQYKYVTAWTAASGGNVVASGTLNVDPVQVGGEFKILAGFGLVRLLVMGAAP